MSRKRWVYTEGGQPLPEPYEVSDDWSNVLPRAATTTEELVHGGTQAPDGTDISTRKKRREYVKRAGVADASDFKGVWAKANAEKAERAALGYDRREVAQITETVGRAAYELQSKKRRR